MKFILTGINSSYYQSAYAIYAIAAAYIGTEEMVVKEYHINQPHGLILKDLFESNGDVYFFSCYLWNIEEILHLSENLKQLKNCTIILGGSEVGYTPEQYFNRSDSIDYIISGEGEPVINQLIIALSNGDNLSAIDCVYDKKKEYYSSSSSSEWLRYRKFPYSESDINSLNGKILYYESSRGCPYQCSYCISQLDRRVRSLLMDVIENELLFFMNHQVKQVKFIDRTFNYDSERTVRILRFILKHNVCTNFHFEICADLLTDELISIFNSAPVGFFQIEVGVQSTNPDTLDAINRKNDLNKISSALTQIIGKKNVHVHADLIAMLPHETWESFQSGFNYLYQIKPHMMQIGFLKILNGTKMYYLTDTYDIKHDTYPPYETFQTSTIPFPQYSELKNLSYLIDKFYNSGIVPNTLDYCIPKYADTPFSFYEAFKNFLSKHHYLERPLSKKDCYIILSDYLQQFDDCVIDSLIAYDYLLENPLHLPDGLNNRVVWISPKKLIPLLADNSFIQTYLPEFEGCREKDIMKHICAVCFFSNPVNGTAQEKTIMLFTDQKENDVFSKNKSVILPFDCYHDLIDASSVRCFS
ncbi:MAG: DUF4080 domain-containing protein [Anaerofustis sp.]